MKLAYNPVTEAALSSAPNSNDIIFDLKGLNIFAKGIKFKGTDTTYSVFKKHTSSSGGGYNGLVPVPSYTTSNNRYLREDGTWQVPSNQYTYSQLNNTDLDTLKTEGKWYYISGGSNNTNGPDGFNNGAELYVGRNASGYRYQKVITLDGDIWVRIFNSSSWGSWIRWYTDANTDSKVLQSATTTSNYRPLILGYQNNTDVSSLANSTTNQVYTTTKIYAQPSTGYLWANKLYSGGKEVLTSHQSLSNYVTINTAQTITGAKTFTGNIYVPSGYIYGVNESGGGILFFDGTRTIVGSTGESTTSATHIRSKTGHITVGTSNDVLYNILDSGNSVYGSSTTSQPIYTPLKINGTTKNISLHGHKHTISDITNFSHTHTSNQITALTGYSKATSVASLNTSDSLNTALGKLEYKLGIAYDLVATANDNDGTIENLKEVLDVLQGIKDTDTIQALLGKYLPLTGGTMKGDITISTDSYIQWNRNTDYAKIHFKNDSDSDSDSYLGFETGDNGNEYFKFSAKNRSTTTELLSIKYDALRFRGTVVSLNGHTHDDRYYTESEINSKLNNYVTLTTNQTISGIKTFSTQQKFTVANGTAPFTVTSSTVVTNLNADKLDGVHLNGIFTRFSANGNATRLVIGGVTKDLTIPYASNAGTLEGYNSGSFVKVIGKRFAQHQQGSYTKILQFTIREGDLAPSISFTWHPSECNREIWADFNINIGSGSPIFYAFWKGTLKRTMYCVGDGTTYSVWVSGTKSSWDPFGVIQVVGTFNISSYSYGALEYSDSEPTGTYKVTDTDSGISHQADVATKLGTTTIGNASRPIYLSNGTPTALSNTVGSSSRPVYLSSGTITQCGTSLGVSITGNAATATKWQTARTISLTGAITGSTSIDGSGNISISTTYATGNISNLDNRYVNITGDTMTGDLGIPSGKSSKDGSVIYGGSLTGIDLNNLSDKKSVIGSLYDTSNSWNSIISVRHRNGNRDGSSYGMYIRSKLTSSSSLYWRQQYEGTWQSEKVLIDSSNYTSYISKIGTSTVGSSTIPIYLKSGVPTQCSTTLGVSITGNASTASKLQTARTLWGQSFDGSADVAGIMTNMIGFSCSGGWTDVWSDGTNSHPWYGYDHRYQNTGVYSTTISDFFGLTLKTSSGNLSINQSGNVGIGTTNPSYKLHVNGTIYASSTTTSSGFKKSGSSDSYLLLGGGGHKAISDFMLKTDELSTNVTTITKSLNVTTSWMDTGINGTDLSTGTYIIQLSPNFNGTGNLWYCYFSGVMSWYSGNTNDSETDEILLHRGGHAYHNTLYLRTVQTSDGNGGMKLQIAASSSIGSTQNYTFKFKRII